MRKLMLMALLAASAAMPAMAQDRGPDRNRDRGAQNESNDARAERRSERAERREQAQRPERAERQRVVELQPAVQQPAVQQVQTGHRSWDRRPGDGATSATRQARRERSSTPDARRVQVQSEQQQRQYRGTDRRSDRSIMGQVLEQNRERQGQVVARRDGDRDGRYQPRHSDTNRQWSNHWRNDRNYDWRHYRDRNRSVYRLGNYYDPYRYGYRRFSIGFSLFPSYYQSSYWLNDPWMYRLPPAYGPYRWVRYYDDALLVDIYTGQVIDVVHSFFW
jgi:Ni/Co efflux regulator RcnB